MKAEAMKAFAWNNLVHLCKTLVSYLVSKRKPASLFIGFTLNLFADTKIVQSAKFKLWAAQYCRQLRLRDLLKNAAYGCEEGLLDAAAEAKADSSEMSLQPELQFPSNIWTAKLQPLALILKAIADLSILPWSKGYSAELTAAELNGLKAGFSLVEAHNNLLIVAALDVQLEKI